MGGLGWDDDDDDDDDVCHTHTHTQVGNVVSVKLTSRDPSPPPFEYVKGGGGIFKV